MSKEWKEDDYIQILGRNHDSNISIPGEVYLDQTGRIVEGKARWALVEGRVLLVAVHRFYFIERVIDMLCV